MLAKPSNVSRASAWSSVAMSETGRSSAVWAEAAGNLVTGTQRTATAAPKMPLRTMKSRRVYEPRTVRSLSPRLARTRDAGHNTDQAEW